MFRIAVVKSVNLNMILSSVIKFQFFG